MNRAILPSLTLLLWSLPASAQTPPAASRHEETPPAAAPAASQAPAAADTRPPEQIAAEREQLMT